MTKPRSARASDILSKSGVTPDKPLIDNFNHFLLLCTIKAQANGSVLKEDLPRNEKTQATAPDTLPWGKRSGSLIGTIPLAQVPTYLRGDE